MLKDLGRHFDQRLYVRLGYAKGYLLLAEIMLEVLILAIKFAYLPLRLNQRVLELFNFDIFPLHCLSHLTQLFLQPPIRFLQFLAFIFPSFEIFFEDLLMFFTSSSWLIDKVGLAVFVGGAS